MFRDVRIRCHHLRQLNLRGKCSRGHKAHRLGPGAFRTPGLPRASSTEGSYLQRLLGCLGKAGSSVLRSQDLKVKAWFLAGPILLFWSLCLFKHFIYYFQVSSPKLVLTCQPLILKPSTASDGLLN